MALIATPYFDFLKNIFKAMMMKIAVVNAAISKYIVPCFMVVVLGGVGNLLGTVLASFGIGIMTDLIGAGRLLTIFPNMPPPIESIVEFFATTSMARVMIFTLIIIFLQFKPSGLFPQKGRMVES